MEKINDILKRRNVVTEIDDSDDDNARKKKKRGPSIIIFVFSLISAFVFWIYVLGYDSAVEERKFKMIEIEIRGEAELYKNSHYTLVETEPVSTDLIIRGKRSLLGNLRTEDVKAYIISELTMAIMMKYDPTRIPRKRNNNYVTSRDNS